jgi:acyl-CoA reductase-like NAD-dependent aldehyde dehydrogenase
VVAVARTSDGPPVERRRAAAPLDGVPVLRRGGPHRSADVDVLCAVDGTALAEVSQAPPLLVRLAVEELRGTTAAPGGRRLDALALAGELFATATLGGETPDDYCRAHARATGVPIRVARRTLGDLRSFAAALPRILQAQRPAGVLDARAGGALGAGRRDVLDARAGGAAVGSVWTPRGDVLGVVAPSNHPATNTAWLHALALGVAVAIRPGSRDPFTPRRLARAIAAAGADRPGIAVLPGPHAAADALVEAANLALVYGGADTVARYRRDRDVLVRGPGHTKVLLDAKLTDARLDLLVDAVAGDGGVRCTNASVILTAGDPAKLAGALAERLAALPARPPVDPEAALPVLPAADAALLGKRVDAVLGGAVDHSRGGERVADLGDGSAALLPVVAAVPDADHPAARCELPFPFVAVAPWRREHGVAPLRGSLAVTLLTGDGALVEAALRERTVRKVLHGALAPAWSHPDLPHDGHLAEFLLEARGFAVLPEAS